MFNRGCGDTEFELGCSSRQFASITSAQSTRCEAQTPLSSGRSRAPTSTERFYRTSVLLYLQPLRTIHSNKITRARYGQPTIDGESARFRFRTALVAGDNVFFRRGSRVSFNSRHIVNLLFSLGLQLVLHGRVRDSPVGDPVDGSDARYPRRKNATGA